MRCGCLASDASQLAARRVPSAFSLLAQRVRTRFAVRQRCLPEVSRFACGASERVSALLLRLPVSQPVRIARSFLVKYLSSCAHDASQLAVVQHYLHK